MPQTTIQKLESKITKLSSIWYEYVSSNHHKDSDCHWYIQKYWSYGRGQAYRIEHYGYVYKDVALEANTNISAHRLLIATIVAAFKKELEACHHILLNKSDYDEWQTTQAQFLVDNWPKIMDISYEVEN